jgi:hypothetical protein
MRLEEHRGFSGMQAMGSWLSRERLAYMRLAIISFGVGWSRCRETCVRHLT